MGIVKILRASAGSGKTYRLAYEYIKRVVIDPSAYSAILAVTFTNKATEEMKTRILKELNDLAKGQSGYMADLIVATEFSQEKIILNATKARSNILHDYSHFAISTIDKFFQKIVHGFIKELGLDFNYTIELNDEAYLAEAAGRVIEKSATDPTVAIIEQKARQARLEAGKNWDIRRDLTSIGKEILSESYEPTQTKPEELISQYEAILNDLKHKQSHLIASCDRVLETMSAHGLSPADFKRGKTSFAFLFVKIQQGKAIDRIDRLHRAAEESQEWYSKTSDRKNDIISILPDLMEQTRLVTELYEVFEIEKNSFDLLTENFYKNLLLGYLDTELQAIWSEKGKVPIHQTTALIKKIVTETAVPFIYEKVGTRFEHYMIDEFQDTSTGQWQNFAPLLDDSVASSDRETVLLIGDVKQAIYRWRGGDWDILANKAAEHFIDNSDDSEQLLTNWRSRSRVVEFNNQLIRAIVQTQDDPTLSRVYQKFEQTVPSGREGGYAQVAMLEDSELEKTILETVKNAISRGFRQKDIAILVRTKNQGREAAQILLRGGYSIIDHESLMLSGSRSVSLILSLIKFAIDRQDLVSLAIYNRLSGQNFDTPFENTELLDEILMQTPTKALDLIITSQKLDKDSEQVGYIQAFYQATLDYCAENISDIRGFIEWWDKNGDKISLYLPSAGDSISILTIHKSKGLQYPLVIIPRCDWRLEPTSNGFTQTTLWANTTEERYSTFNPAPVNYKEAMARSFYHEAYEHEKVFSLIDAVNMLYVAATRAEQELYLFYPCKTKVNEDTGEIKMTVPANSIFSLIESAGFSKIEAGVKEIYQPVEKPKVTQIFFDHFSIEESAQKIRTSWATQKYYEDGGLIETPISRGILMHKLFSSISTTDQIEQAIGDMTASGELPLSMTQELRADIEKALCNPTVASWFSPDWTLYAEQAIILPGVSSTRRPDRVITRDKSAVVVDYKFGQVRKSSYDRQVSEYMSLLQQMGYTDVKGYVWYVDLEQIDQITL